MPELDDAAIELRLRRVLGARLGELRLDLDVDELERRRVRRDTTRRRQRILIGLGLAATMLVPVGWVMSGAYTPTPPMPADTLRTPGPSATASLARSGDFQAIAVRGAAGSPAGTDLDVVAVRADGQERLVTQIPAASLPAGFRFALGAAVSSNGWLALGDLTAPRVVLVDLRAPSTPARALPGSFEPDSVAWGPDGRIAVRLVGRIGGLPDQIMAIDPATGVSNSASVAGAFATAPLAWAADGSGFVAPADALLLTNPNGSPGWHRETLGTNTTEPGFVPVFDARHRWMSMAGDRLTICQPERIESGHCRAAAGFELGRQDVAGALTIWDVTPTAGGIDDAVFAAADRGIWLLSRDLSSGVLVLDRMDQDGNVVLSRTAAIPAGVGPATTDDLTNWPPTVTLDGMAPDDSLARITFSFDDPDIGDWMLLPTDGLAATYHLGNFAGYLRSTVADALGGEAFSQVPTANGPALSHVPKLPTIDELDAFAGANSGVKAADPVLLLRSSAEPPGPLTKSVEQLGGHRLAIQFACSGPGSVEVDVFEGVLQRANASECRADDQSPAGFIVESTSLTRAVHIELHADPGTRWRVAVYDLGP